MKKQLIAAVTLCIFLAAVTLGQIPFSASSAGGSGGGGGGTIAFQVDGASGGSWSTLSFTTGTTITPAISVGGSTGTVQFEVNSATVPVLASTNTFTNNQNIVGTLAVSSTIDALAPVTIATGAFSFGTTYKQAYFFNQHATAGTGVTGTLPTAAAGRQYCVMNSYNGSAANTGVLTIATSASGQYIIFTDGTLSATGGNVTSGGAAGDGACVIGVDSTHWQLRVNQGTWTKH